MNGGAIGEVEGRETGRSWRKKRENETNIILFKLKNAQNFKNNLIKNSNSHFTFY